MATKFELRQDENLLREEMVSYIKSKLHIQFGQMYLTTKRLVWSKNPNIFFGLIGMLFQALRGGVVFDIPLSDIASYENAKYGLNKKVLGIKLRDGTDLKFALSSKYEEWEQAFKSAGK